MRPQCQPEPSRFLSFPGMKNGYFPPTETMTDEGLPWWLNGIESACKEEPQETQIWSLGQEDPVEKGVAIHSSNPAPRIPWTEEPSALQSIGRRVGHDWRDITRMHGWLTMLFQVDSKGIQPYICMYPFSSKLLSHPGCQITLSRVPCVYSRSLLVIHLKNTSVYLSIPNSLTIPYANPSPDSSKHKFIL